MKNQAAPSPKIRWLQSMPFLLLHIAALGVFFFPFAWKWVGLCVASYYVRMFFITGAYHRYFSHRSYKMSRIPQFLMAWGGTMCTQKGVLWWAANHRHHHRYSDLEQDIHSPIQKGFWWSHVGWILSDAYEQTYYELIQDFSKFPELVWLNRNPMIPPVLYAIGLYLMGGWPAFFWGFALSTVLLWHGTFTINSLSHVFGSQRYESGDTSRNNFWLALITLGEGWHNNHHTYMSSTNQGFFWWEIDGSYYVLKALSWVGFTKELRKPPLETLEAKRLNGKRSVILAKADAAKRGANRKTRIEMSVCDEPTMRTEATLT